LRVIYWRRGARLCSGVVGWGTALQVRRSRVRFPVGSMALWSTRPLTEMSTKAISWGVKTAGA
jgi:hypothetical protein